MQSILSIIIPTYASFNELKSWEVRNKPNNFKNIDFIFVDSNSNDGSKDIFNYLLNKYSNVYVHYLKSNIYEAMNYGVKISKANWLLFKGVDDTLLNSALSLTNRVESNPDLFIYDLLIVNYQISNKNIIKQKISINQLKYPHHQSCIFNKQTLLNLNYIYNTKYLLFSDMDLIFRILNNKRILYLPYNCVSFSKGGKSTNGKYFKESLIELTTITFKNNKLLTKFYFVSILRIFYYYIDSKLKLNLSRIILSIL